MFTTLIVEDNAIFRKALHAALHSRFPFLTLATAGSVEEALVQIDELRPDLIFMDVALPDGNGLALTKRIRVEGIDAVVIVLTSHDLPEYRDLAFHNGADHFLSKSSMALSDIFAIVESVVGSRFRALIITGDADFKNQIDALLSRTRPRTVVAAATDWEAALDAAGNLLPNLVVLHSNAAPNRVREFCDALRARVTGTNLALVHVRDIGPEEVWSCSADYCISSAAALGHEMVAIINSLPAAPDSDSKR